MALADGVSVEMLVTKTGGKTIVQSFLSSLVPAELCCCCSHPQQLLSVCSLS